MAGRVTGSILLFKVFRFPFLPVFRNRCFREGQEAIDGLSDPTLFVFF